MGEKKQAAAKANEPQAYDPPHVPMTEEFDRAKWTLPPLGVVAIALVAVMVIVGVMAWRMQPKPVSSGTIDDVVAVATQDGKTMAAINVTFSNIGSGRPL